MIKLAICDDQDTLCSQLEENVIIIFEELGVSVDIEIYNSGESLCKAISDGESFDLIFLDIELFELNGVQVGNFIRKKDDDYITQIVYISSKTEYALELFEISPLDFLVKPLTYEKVKKFISKFIAINKVQEDLFTYKWGRNTYKIKISDIIYLKVENRTIKMFTTKKDFRVFYGKLEELYNTYFKKHGFLYVHASTLANYSHVTAFEYDHLIMSNGEKLQISYSKRKEVRDAQIELEKRGLIK